MTEDEYSTEMELYGVSPNFIAFIMFFTMLLAPLGYVPEFIDSIFYFSIDPKVYSFMWQIFFDPFHFDFHFALVSFPEMFFMLPFTILNWVYAYLIVRYYQGKTSKYLPVMVGTLSVLVPLLASIYWSVIHVQSEIIYPIPLQFIIGSLLLWRIEGPEVISPWSGLRLDFSWWKWGQVKRKKQVVIVEEKKSAVPEEDWLEG
ncbi:MAG: hypothetical protein ACFFEK_02125 [Candidatus Thorarchaeota archaeon]